MNTHYFLFEYPQNPLTALPSFTLFITRYAEVSTHPLHQSWMSYCVDDWHCSQEDDNAPVSNKDTGRCHGGSLGSVFIAAVIEQVEIERFTFFSAPFPFVLSSGANTPWNISSKK